MERSELLRIVRLCGPKLRDSVSSLSTLDESSNNDLELLDVTTLCSLWAGMGHIYKVTILQREPLTQKSTTTTSIIVKHVAPRRQQQQSVGDRRKAASYLVEANFYEHVAPDLLAIHKLPIPKPLYIERRNDEGEEIIIAMTYIEPPSPRSLSLHQDHHSQQRDQQRQVLTWLATLHAAYWGVTDETIQRLGLQPIGTYWHFATRQEEHRNMPNNNCWQSRLKLATRAIDARLQRDLYQCVVHGDAKDENILLSGRGSRQNGEHEKTTVYFCDFQYCGKGVPAQDLAYYFCTACSSNSSSSVEEEEAILLDFYLQQLALKVRSNAALPTLRELHDMMDLAHCDYYRFMCGWGFWGSGGNGGVDRVQRVLDRLDGGIKLASEELYDAAVRREYG
jgi:thiamine kinase-like enzyme